MEDFDFLIKLWQKLNQYTWFQLIILFLCISPLLISANFLFLKDPPVWPDEPVFFDIAKNSINIGKVQTGIFGKALPNFENHTYAFPPLYFYILGSWLKMFGENIETARIFSVLVGVLILLTFFVIAKKLVKVNNLALLATFYLAISADFSRATRLARMDLLAMLFLLCSLLAFIFAREKNKLLYYLGAGFFSALSVLTHHMGILTTILLLTLSFMDKNTSKRKLLICLLIILPVLAGTIFWIITLRGELYFVIGQFKNLMVLKNNMTSYILVFFKTDFQNKMLLILDAFFVISLLVITIKFKQRKNLLVLIPCFVSFIAVALGKDLWYAIYLRPFVILVAIFLLRNLISLKKEFLFMVVLIFIGISMIMNIFELVDKIDKTSTKDYHQFSGQIAKALPAESTVCMFSVPDPYFDLQSKKLRVFEFVYLPGFEQDEKNFFDECNFAIFNIFPDKFSTDYLNKNSEKKFIIGSQDSYSTFLIQLKPKDKRI